MERANARLSQTIFPLVSVALVHMGSARDNTCDPAPRGAPARRGLAATRARGGTARRYRRIRPWRRIKRRTIKYLHPAPPKLQGPGSPQLFATPNKRYTNRNY